MRRRLGPGRGGRRLFRSLPPQHQQFADMLDGCRVQRCANALQHGIALVALVAEHPYLDQLVRQQVDVELVQDRGGQPVLTDAHDRMQMMRLGAKRPAPGGSQRFHRGILSDRGRRQAA